MKFNGWPRNIIGHVFYTTSSFVHHFKSIGEFKLELHSGNAQFGSKSMILFSCVTLKFDVWPWKTIGYLFYATSSFVHHFVALGEFKLELQSGNAQFGSNSTIFTAIWPWNLTYDLEQGKSEGFDSCDRPSNLKLDSNRQFFRPCDRGILWMTSKNNRALQLDLQSRNAQFGSKLVICHPVWPWNLMDDLGKQ